MIICSDCTTANYEGVFFCEECGNPLFGANQSKQQQIAATGMKAHIPTQKLKTTPLQVKSALLGTTALSESSILIMHFETAKQEIDLFSQEDFILGRRDNAQGIYPDVDLTPHGGIDLGVSRKHAVLRRDENSLTIVDLGSANGTYLNGKKIIPSQPHILRDGDEIRFGKLVSHIYFK